MNIKYWFEFKGLDDVLNRVEILTDSNVMPEEVHAPDEAFSLQYLTVKKLDVVQGSQATLRLISQKIFEFIGLHTDDMQEYTIRFYRDGRLYWLGFLDSELYSENLTDYPPYPVEFAGADFNITKRLKYRDGAGNRYTDVVPLITHLKRCFDLLGLPFDKLYIGCTTMANDVPADASETALHVLYMMSANFYDEDNEPMTCREVMENILRPFGLMMVQKSGSVFIYDYNTVKLGLPMKRYNFSSFTYEAEEMVNFDLGDISDIKTLTTDASFGFEEMINNVQITSSLYGKNIFFNEPISEKTLSEEFTTIEKDGYVEEIHEIDKNIEKTANENFIIYKKDESNQTLIGAKLPYAHTPDIIQPVFRVKADEVLIRTNPLYYLNVKVQAYINTRKNPFDSDEKSKAEVRSRAIRLYCNLYLVDTEGRSLMYYMNGGIGAWGLCGADGSFPQGQFCLLFCNSDLDEHGLPSKETLDKWVTNSDQIITFFGLQGFKWEAYKELNYGQGLNVPLRLAGPENGQLVVSGVYGSPIFEITNKCLIDDPTLMDKVDPFPEENVVNILLNNFSISIKDSSKKDASTDDSLFKSYVNKKVATDFEEVELKCISANEEQIPIGRANILKKVDNYYKLQPLFTRSGQTDILERLLMCTIHSNHSRKNVSLSVIVKMTKNPALAYCTYKNVIHSDGMYITGATLDFYNAMTTIKAEEFSADDARLSDIPYD